MKKTLLISALVSCMLAQSAFAYCDYNDRINFVGNAGMKVTGVTGAGIEAYRVSSTAVVLNSPSSQDGCAGAGIATIQLASQKGDTCQIAIKDGPSEWDPTVQSVRCTNGVHFSSLIRGNGHNYEVSLDK